MIAVKRKLEAGFVKDAPFVPFKCSWSLPVTIFPGERQVWRFQALRVACSCPHHPDHSHQTLTPLQLEDSPSLRLATLSLVLAWFHFSPDRSLQCSCVVDMSALLLGGEDMCRERRRMAPHACWGETEMNSKGLCWWPCLPQADLTGTPTLPSAGREGGGLSSAPWSSGTLLNMPSQFSPLSCQLSL